MEYLQYPAADTFLPFLNVRVLNLIINGIPSILSFKFGNKKRIVVLNLIINGIPSILAWKKNILEGCISFKPCYKWNTFNTWKKSQSYSEDVGFKPCYKWNTFNTTS